MKMNYSIKTKLFGLVLAVVILLGFGTYLNLSHSESTYKRTINSQMENLSNHIGKSFTDQLYERYGDVQAIAQNTAVKSLGKEQIVSSLDSYVGLYGIYDLIVVIDKNGKFVAANSVNVQGQKIDTQKLQAIDFNQFTWFQSALNGKFTFDKKNNYSGTYIEGFISDDLVKSVLGEAKFGSSFSSQIHDYKGEVIGVISARAGSRWIENEIIRVHKNLITEHFSESKLYFLGNEGQILIESSLDTSGPKLSYKNDSYKNENINQVLQGLQSIIIQEKMGSKIILDSAQNKNVLASFYVLDNEKSIADLNWQILVTNSEKSVYAAVKEEQVSAYIILVVSSLIGLVLAVWYGFIISKSLTQITQTLQRNSDELTEASAKIATGATQLSEASSQQSAALQETAAAIDEINAMVEKNADASNQSRQASQLSRSAAEESRTTVSNLLEAIEGIDHSNEEIGRQMQENSQQLSEITKLINDISNKTKIINEIVFQTKLLSFNASVEAARAGEYGKGFAVVAHEVGNLAQLSGSASKEISEMLEVSIGKVNSIVAETSSRVERLMKDSKSKVQRGSETAYQCNESLEKIINQVQSVDALIAEIAVASNEQANGVREISKAISQMDQVNQQNAEVAQSSSLATEDLRRQSEFLNTLVNDLSQIVTGKDVQAENSSQPVKSNFEAKKSPRLRLLDDVPKAHKSELSSPSKKSKGAPSTPNYKDTRFAS